MTITMKQSGISIFLTILFCMVGTKALAYDIEVVNADGVTIYYNYVNDGKELEVTNAVNNSETDSSLNPYKDIIVIPEEVTFMNRTRMVTAIGNSAFYRCVNLTSVTIPKSVKTIGKRAFDNCERLSSVKCYYGLTDICENAFLGCLSLSSVTIPSSVRTIGHSAFYNCKSLKSVHISDLESWCNIVFDWNSNPLLSAHHLYLNNEEVKDLVIPQNVNSILDFAFQGCSGLTSVSIPNSVKTIGWHSFDGCEGISSITIPNSVTSINMSAFKGIQIQTVVSLINDPFEISGKNSYGNETFSVDTFNNATLFVPIGTKEKYMDTAGWKDFLFINEGTDDISDGIVNVRAMAVMIQNTGGQLIIKGINDGTQVDVFNINGVQAGSAISHSGSAAINTDLPIGSIIIIKIGERSIKVALK